MPLYIFRLSSSESGTVSIQSVPGPFSMNGQSTEKRTRSMPIWRMVQSSAGVEKKPLVVTGKCSQKVRLNLMGFWHVGIIQPKANPT